MAGCKLASLDSIGTIPETKIAYLAGLIDADGTVTMAAAFRRRSGKLSYPTPMVLVVNGNRGLIRWIKETVGFGCAYKTKTNPIRPDQNDAHWNPVHRYQITGRAAIALLSRCRPYMRVKDKQADLVCKIAVRGIDFLGRASVEQHALAQMVTRQIRALNQRGRKDAVQYEMV